MKRLLLSLFFGLLFCSLSAQERRPIDNQHPLWLIHIDVWNSADPQKIIDLIPDNIKPYVCMNLSLSCGYDTQTNMYRMPRNAVRTYKSWASVCQQNGLWFTCQPASGGHTHIQDDDLETFEYFFKTYPNFLGWNYAEQFWGFDEAGDKSSSTQASRIALFAKLVEMSHKYGGFLTVSFCGNIWSHLLNPIGMMKRNTDLLRACKDYPEAILWLYKYTTSSCFYNNESVTWGPFISGLAKNYGVRYDNCGWNGAMDALLGENHGKKYPGTAGIATVMEQTCVNGGAVWDGPELIWTEDFQNLSNSTVDGYTRRNWGTFPNFRGIWLDMFGKIIDGTMYIPSREEVLEKTKVVIRNDISSGNDEQKYAAWGDLYDGLYKQNDPFNRGNGQWMDNFCYFKKTGRYGAIPIVIGLYDDDAKNIPVQVNKSQYTSRWNTQAKKVAEFDAQYPEVSTGDLYVNRYRNQLVTYTPYTYLNKKTSAQATIPLQYNTCQTLELKYDKMSSGLIREYSDHIDLYLNNFRADTTMLRKDTIRVYGVTSQPSFKLTKHGSYTASAIASYDNEAQLFTVSVTHLGPLDLTLNCQGDIDRTETPEPIPAATALPQPKQPDAFNGTIIIEAENMDHKNVKNVALTHSGWWAQDYNEFSALGYVEMGTNASASLRHQLKLNAAGSYDILIRYCNTTKAGDLQVSVNGQTQTVQLEKVSKNDWRKAKVSANLNAGMNTLIITNTGGAAPVIDQVIYMPQGTPQEKFLVTIRDAEHGSVTADVSEAAEGQTVTLTAHPDAGCQLKELRIVNSVYYTMAQTIAIKDPTGEITFTMPEDNVTIQPVFADTSVAYQLDFTTVLNGAIPPGWRCIQENGETHEYPNTFGSGARTFQGFTGYQGKALYWRNDRAEYGRQTAYPLTLEPGDYKLTFAMAAWKESPKYKVQILNAGNNKSIATSQVLTASPNVDGSTSGNVSSAATRELPFTITEKGKYVISFTDETGTGGYHEYLILECRVNNVFTDGIMPGTINRQLPIGIYSPAGHRIGSLQRGLNIIVDEDGTTRKVMIK